MLLPWSLKWFCLALAKWPYLYFVYHQGLCSAGKPDSVCLHYVVLIHMFCQVSSTSFQKSIIGWPQQPLTEIMVISVKNCIFDDPFHKKGPVLVSLVPGMIQPSQTLMFLMKWNCKGHWDHGGCWGCRGHWGCRVSEKSLLRFLESSRFLNSALFWCFEKIVIW